MRLINADLYWDKLIARRELNISAGLPAAYNSGINQAISILNGMKGDGGEYIRRSDVLEVLARHYAEIAQYSPRQEQWLQKIKNDIKALETYTLDSSATFNQYGDNGTCIHNAGTLNITL